jgi:RNA-directed DNA polymerase
MFGQCVGRVIMKLMPKSQPGLFSLLNLYQQYLACRRNKRNTLNALSFEFNAECELGALALELHHKSYQPSRSIAFVVAKPKLREIVAADFRDRIVHHLLIERLEAIFEPKFIYDSYACRKNKGTHKAVARVEQFIRKLTTNGEPGYFLQLDIHNFFMNIDKNILIGLLDKQTRDNKLRWLARIIIWLKPQENMLQKGDFRLFSKLPQHKSLFNAPEGKGLPIGNLTSQFFANVYLDQLDQFVKHTLKCRYYVRYCDDFILLDSSKPRLLEFKSQIETFLAERLLLKLNPRYNVVLPLSNGIDYLGYIIYPYYRLVRKRVIDNLKNKLDDFSRKLYLQTAKDVIQVNYDYPLLASLHATLASYLGHLQHANSYRLLESLFKRFSWLNYFFNLVWQQGKARLERRYCFKKVGGGISSQYGYYISCFSGYLLLFQVGCYYEFYTELDSELRKLLNLRRLQHSSRGAYYGFPVRKFEGYSQILLNHGYRLVIVKESERYLGRLKQRLPESLLFKSERTQDEKYL